MTHRTDDEKAPKAKNAGAETWETDRANVALSEGKNGGAVPPSLPALLRPYLVELHGKQFILYAGLLAAHAKGLVSLKARLMSVTSDLALAEAEAVFQDGSVYSEAADATPSNVRGTVKAHFPRMALTRAKARCLRDALNIALVWSWPHDTGSSAGSVLHGQTIARRVYYRDIQNLSIFLV